MPNEPNKKDASHSDDPSNAPESGQPQGGRDGTEGAPKGRENKGTQTPPSSEL